MELKLHVLTELEKNRDKYISGQELAERIGVSRAAVWKAVRALQQEGYAVEAATNRGYRLSLRSDIISAQGIAVHLPEQLREMEIVALHTVDSTNSEAKRQISASGARPMLIASDTQTAGRGRRGNSFFSPPGRGVYFSAVFCPRTPLEDALRITAAAGVAVCEAVEALCGRDARIKWVNDVFLDGKKVCGILTEGVSDLESGMAEAIIVGIGVNFRSGSFPPELSGIATALDPQQSLTRNRLIAEIVGRLYALAENLAAPALMESYRARSLVLGKTVRFYRGQQSFEGEAVEINDQANLVVRLPDGTFETLKAGEISIGSGAFSEKCGARTEKPCGK